MKIKLKISQAFLLALSIGALTACGGGSKDTPPDPIFKELDRLRIGSISEVKKFKEKEQILLKVF